MGVYVCVQVSMWLKLEGRKGEAGWYGLSTTGGVVVNGLRTTAIESLSLRKID